MIILKLVYTRSIAGKNTMKTGESGIKDIIYMKKSRQKVREKVPLVKVAPL
jgi:hypothetical protein